MASRIRVRFAPSPTGPLHMGGVRTALYNYLFARKNGGDFILRIEDTDQKRYVPGAESYIQEALAWCGISPNEGFGIGGDSGPYQQSKRSDLYQRELATLLSNGKAYKAFDTPEEMDAVRKAAEAEGKVWQYDAITRMSMRNSFSLSPSETAALEASNAPFTIRFCMPEKNHDVEFSDVIRGHIRVSTAVLDDKVLMKADGLPTYHLANVVDDHHMAISHVIRGEEWLPSAPLHVLLYEAFGWEPPLFAHLSLILKPTGNGKLSKRDGDQGGFPIFPLNWTDPTNGQISNGYRENGYSPEAFVNMLLLLGWSSGGEQELFSLEEAVEAFDLPGVIKSGARFNPDKARWFNEQYLRQAPVSDWLPAFREIASELVSDWSDEKCLSALDMLLERVSFLHEVLDHTYVFEAPDTIDEKLVAKKWKPETSGYLTSLKEVLEQIEVFDSPSIEEAFKAFLEEKSLGFGAVLLPLRLVLTGAGGGPSMFDFAAFIGREETLRRIDLGLAKVS
ncbi:MAG: glutamate--tRNA ligase [Flavobacteriales bacterium]|nr:glutamate--tRNA ligase [Flavobacteriales bacterium]